MAGTGTYSTDPTLGGSPLNLTSANKNAAYRDMRTDTQQYNYNPWYIDQSNPLENNQAFVDLMNAGQSGISAGSMQQDLLGYGKQFAGQFKNMTGRDPTEDDFNNFYQNIVSSNIVNSSKGVAGTNYADVQNLINPYLQNQYQGDIQKYQQGVAQQNTQNEMQQAQTMVDQMNQNTLKNLTSPESMQKFGQGMNQMGMLNSGAYSTGLADELAQGANQNQTMALQSVGLPAVSGQASMANAPYSSFWGNLNPNLQSFGQGQNEAFGASQNEALMKQLQGMMTPTDLQQWAPIISGGLQGAGAAYGGPGKTFICTAMREAGVLSPEQVDRIHNHLFPIFPKRLREVLMYGIYGPQIVAKAIQKGIDFKKWKQFFYDNVMAQQDPDKSFNLYAYAFGLLWEEVSNG